MENDLLNFFSELQAIIKYIDKPLTAKQISKKFNLTPYKTRMLLDQFIQQGDTIQQCLIIFTADIKTSKGPETLLIPSYSEKLESVLDDPGLIDLSVYAIWRKMPIVDYSCLNNEPESIDILNVAKNIAPVKQLDNISLMDKKPVIEIKAKCQEVKDNEEYYYEEEPMKQLNIAEPIIVNENHDKPYQTLTAKIEIEKPKKRKQSEDSTDSVNLKRRKESENSGENKKVLKTKKVKQTKNYVDEKGYLITIDEWVDEEYWAEEKVEKPIPASKPINNIDIKSKKGQNKKPTNQASLHSFFKK
jgi:hypothetical protein